MNHQREVVLGNAVLWALSPMKRFPGGMRIGDGKIRQIYNRDLHAAATNGGPRGHAYYTGAHRCPPAFLCFVPDAALW